jgi:hypothetical protein
LEVVESWSREAKGTEESMCEKCNENQNCKTRKGSQRKCEITNASDDD